MKQLPRSVRNNNPGNIRHVPANKWQGILPYEKRNPAQRAESQFEVFESPVFGFSALASLLQTYQDRHGLNTIRKIINRWAPPKGDSNGAAPGGEYTQDTSAYVNAVASAVGVRADDKIDLHLYEFMRPLVEAVAIHETGKGYTWDAKLIDEGLRRAGITPDAKTVAKVPVTAETVGATTAGALGVGQIAEVLPQVSAAIDSANTNLSSGSIVQLVMGVATIGIAVYIAYAQVKKHQAGLQ